MTLRGKQISRAGTDVMPEHDYQEIMAIRAFARGGASPTQQRAAYEWIIKKAGMIGGLSYNPRLEGETLVNEGRRFVAVCIVAMTTESQQSIDKRFPGPRSGREPDYNPEEE